MLATLEPCLEALVNHRSFVEAARALRGCYFPLFPPDREYMERCSGLHYCVKTLAGYRITPNVIRTLTTDAIPGNRRPLPRPLSMTVTTKPPPLCAVALACNIDAECENLHISPQAGPVERLRQREIAASGGVCTRLTHARERG